MPLTIDALIVARQRLNAYLNPTKLEPSQLGDNIWFKLENTNLTHSFKIRGALNAVLSLEGAERERGLVAASSGNHAQGLAYASHLTGASAQILMPAHTPTRKVDGVRRYGGEVVLDFPNYDACEVEALRRARDDGMTYISPYNDERIIAGAGTIGLEIVEQLPDVERIVVCVGGGGLISGVALAVKSLKPDCEVVGVNALSAPTMHNLLYGTDYRENWDTLAEALSGGIEAGAVTIDMTREYVDKIVLVTEEQIAAAMTWLALVPGWLVEGGGAVGVAALMDTVVPDDGKRTVVVISGGNVDVSLLQRLGL